MIVLSSLADKEAKSLRHSSRGQHARVRPRNAMTFKPLRPVRALQPLPLRVSAVQESPKLQNEPIFTGSWILHTSLLQAAPKYSKPFQGFPRPLGGWWGG